MNQVEILEAIEGKRRGRLKKKPKEEANAAGTLAAVERPEGDKKKESGIADGSFVMRSGMDFIRVKSAYRLSESAQFTEATKAAKAGDATAEPCVRVVLITEGLGNRKNMNYYGPEAVASAPAVFEGKPAFLDHPSESDERDIPERRVRDKCGFFKNCHVEEVGGVTACVGDLIFDSSDGGQMAYHKALSAIKYRDHFPNASSEYVGLSVNADGATEERRMEVDGETLEVNYVTRFTDAMSCDIVTSPARGGKFLALVESAAGANKTQKQEVMHMVVESLKAALSALQEGQRNPKLAKAKMAEATRRMQPLLKDAIEAEKRLSSKEDETSESGDEESKDDSSDKGKAKAKKGKVADAKESDGADDSDDSEDDADDTEGTPATQQVKPGHKITKTTKVTVAHDAKDGADASDEDSSDDKDDGDADESDEESEDMESAGDEAKEANRIAVQALIKESGLPKDALELDYLASIGLKEARKEIARAKKISESVTARVLKTLDVPSAHYGKVSESTKGAGNNNALFSACME